jgi:hypothetical protein
MDTKTQERQEAESSLVKWVCDPVRSGDPLHAHFANQIEDSKSKNPC